MTPTGTRRISWFFLPAGAAAGLAAPSVVFVLVGIGEDGGLALYFGSIQ